MATKPKTSDGNAPAKDASLQTMFSKALEEFTAGKLKEAAVSFEALREEAVNQEDIRLGHTAQGYLKAILTRQEALAVATPLSAELSAQVELNRQAPEAALALLEEGLRAHPDHAGLHYLKALALALLDQGPAAAEALTAATSLDPGLVYQFRLDADFDGVRHTPAFSPFNLG